MRNLIVAALFACLLPAAPAWAQTPIGEWRVADGGAHIRIVDCGGVLWGVVSWEKTPGRDSENPDPAKRQRPTLGMPVLLHMTPGDRPGRWEGEVYNAENGRTYDATITLRGAQVLRVEGCALGIFCGGENWTRLAQAQPAQAQHGRNAGASALDPAGSPARLPAAAICAGTGAAAGRSH